MVCRVTPSLLAISETLRPSARNLHASTLRASACTLRASPLRRPRACCLARKSGVCSRHLPEYRAACADSFRTSSPPRGSSSRELSHCPSPASLASSPRRPASLPAATHKDRNRPAFRRPIGNDTGDTVGRRLEASGRVCGRSGRGVSGGEGSRSRSLSIDAGHRGIWPPSPKPGWGRYTPVGWEWTTYRRCD